MIAGVKGGLNVAPPLRVLSRCVKIDHAVKFLAFTNPFVHCLTRFFFLRTVINSPFVAVSAPVSVAVDPTGKFAYVANLGGNNVSAYSIGANGALTPDPIARRNRIDHLRLHRLLKGGQAGGRGGIFFHGSESAFRYGLSLDCKG
jgi:hypothetical protein